MRASVSSQRATVPAEKARRGAPEIKCTAEAGKVDYSIKPLLALDVSAHAYFLDYGFSKEDYLRAAVSRLSLGKLFPERKKSLDTGVQR